jgi:negative regulator of flagellin synthesis FlgM
MLIDRDIVSLSSVGVLHAAAPKAEAGQPGKTGSAPSAERVELSIGKAAIDRLKEAAGNGESFRAERVAEIRQKMSEGSYRVDARSVASRMMGQNG